jgi:hypothetical protein
MGNGGRKFLIVSAEEVEENSSLFETRTEKLLAPFFPHGT